MFFTLGSINLYYAAMVGDEHLAMRAALERARISRVSLRLFGCASEVARHIEGNQSSSVLTIAQAEMNSGSVTASIVLTLGSLVIALSCVADPPLSRRVSLLSIASSNARLGPSPLRHHRPFQRGGVATLAGAATNHGGSCIDSQLRTYVLTYVRSESKRLLVRASVL